MDFQDPESISKTLYSNSNGLQKRIEMWNRYGCSNIPYREFLLAHLPSSFMNYLDVGCGNAIYSSEFARFATDVCAMLDCSSNILEEAKNNVRNCALKCNVDFICGDICNMPFEDNSFDFITAMHIFHHVKDIQCGLSEIIRVLKPKGKLMITTYDKLLEDPLNIYHYSALRGLNFPSSMLDTVEYLKFSGIKPRDYLARYFDEFSEHIYENSMEIDDIDDILDYYSSAMMFRMFHGNTDDYDWNMLYKTVKNNVSQYMRTHKTLEIIGNVKMFIVKKR